jgi:fructose/tagatose bisphosphate aldolase
MPLVDLNDMLRHARANRYAVGAYGAVDCSFIAAILAGAERTRAPVIVSFAQAHFAHYDFPMLMAAAEVAAKSAKVPVALFLDHGTELDSAIGDEQFHSLIERGVTKINYYTALSDLATAAASHALSPINAGYTAALDAVRVAVADEVARTCEVFGAAGRADAIMQPL